LCAFDYYCNLQRCCFWVDMMIVTSRLYRVLLRTFFECLIIIITGYRIRSTKDAVLNMKLNLCYLTVLWLWISCVWDLYIFMHICMKCHIYVTCLISVWNVTYRWHFSYICMKCHIYLWHVSYLYEMSHICDMSHICMKCHIYLWHVSYLYEMSHICEIMMTYIWLSYSSVP